MESTQSSTACCSGADSRKKGKLGFDAIRSKVLTQQRASEFSRLSALDHYTKQPTTSAERGLQQPGWIVIGNSDLTRERLTIPTTLTSLRIEHSLHPGSCIFTSPKATGRTETYFRDVEVLQPNLVDHSSCPKALTLNLSLSMHLSHDFLVFSGLCFHFVLTKIRFPEACWERSSRCHSGSIRCHCRGSARDAGKMTNPNAFGRFQHGFQKSNMTERTVLRYKKKHNG